MDEWIDFYKKCFASRGEAEAFVKACESQEPPNNTAKIIMHQGQRLVSLAEDMPKLRPGRESLQVFFLIVCAEAVSKLDAGSLSGMKSKEAVIRFFKELVPEGQQHRLADGLRRRKQDEDRRRVREPLEWMKSITPEERMLRRLVEAVEVLYAVRCSVAHEGVYWEISFKSGNLGMLSIVNDWVTTASITMEELCNVVAHGCVKAAQKHL